MLDTLLTTLIRELQNDTVPGRQEEANNVARRFVRSVARIFVIFTIEMAPNTTKRRRLEISCVVEINKFSICLYIKIFFFNLVPVKHCSL